LQSSSSVLHVSGVGPVPPWHVSLPPTQLFAPNLHTPTFEPHWPPPPGLPSSGLPLQLLSTPSQTSAEGPVAPTHAQPDAPWQTSAPTWHGAVSVPGPLHVA